MAKIPKDHEKYDLLPETRNDDTWNELDIDNDIERWIPAFIDAKAGRRATCPRCGSADTKAIAEDLGDGIGFVTITCQSCGRTGYFSRVDFSNWNDNK